MIYSAEFVESLFWTLPEPFPGYSPVVDNYQEDRPFGFLDVLFLKEEIIFPLIIDISDIKNISDFSLFLPSATLSGCTSVVSNSSEITMKRSACQQYAQACDQRNHSGPSSFNFSY